MRNGSTWGTEGEKGLSAAYALFLVAGIVFPLALFLSQSLFPFLLFYVSPLSLSHAYLLAPFILCFAFAPHLLGLSASCLPSHYCLARKPAPPLGQMFGKDCGCGMEILGELKVKKA
jgi:hypothetical protein